MVFFFFFSSESASRVYVQQPYRRMEVTKDLYGLNLHAKLMMLLARSSLVWPSPSVLGKS